MPQRIHARYSAFNYYLTLKLRSKSQKNIVDNIFLGDKNRSFPWISRNGNGTQWFYVGKYNLANICGWGSVRWVFFPIPKTSATVRKWGGKDKGHSRAIINMRASLWRTYGKGMEALYFTRGARRDANLMAAAINNKHRSLIARESSRTAHRISQPLYHVFIPKL